MTRRTYTPVELRKLAADRGPFYADTSRAALMYCADVMEAEQALIVHYEALMRERAHGIGADAAPQEHPDAKRLDWLGSNMFASKWNGVIDSGSRMQWSVAPDYRHKTPRMVGDTFRAAIDAAMSATAPAQGGST